MIDRKGHDKEGAILTAGIIEQSFGYPEGFIDKVMNCVEAHRGYDKPPAEYVEARLVEAADTFEGLSMERIWAVRKVYPRPTASYVYSPAVLSLISQGKLIEASQ